jgi:Wiskott-Aldrich syndrome protein
MPAQSSISSSDKERIKAAFPTATSKILTATVARVYYAYPDPDEWSYGGLEGALTLVSDKIKGGFWLRLVDMTVRRLLSLFLLQCH